MLAAAVAVALALVSSLVVHARLVIFCFVLLVASRCSPSHANASYPRLSTLSADPSHSSTDLDWTSSHITYITALGVVFMRQSQRAVYLTSGSSASEAPRRRHGY
ncbi:hypothetical protein B0H10DRAFT_2207965 [Mycena sp. CBHHK59/15]|nr:hypothetical protein B0H10DRAFT_2207965 [Mycena sp. CBHHK59/15]